MIIEKQYVINESLQLVDLNQDYINFEAKFDVKAENKDDKFMLSIVDESQLEDEKSISFQNVVGHIDGDISNNDKRYKNFYIALKAKNDVKLNVKIDINNTTNDKNDLNTNQVNENNTMAEEPQRTNLNEIFDESTSNPPQDLQSPPRPPQDLQSPPRPPQDLQSPPRPARKRRKKRRRRSEQEPDSEQESGMGYPPQEMEYPQHHPQHHPQHEEQKEEPSSVLDYIIKYKYIIFGICIVLLGYYYITYIDPSMYQKIFGSISSMTKKSSPASSPQVMKTPIDTFTEKLANLSV